MGEREFLRFLPERLPPEAGATFYSGWGATLVMSEKQAERFDRIMAEIKEEYEKGAGVMSAEEKKNAAETPSNGEVREGEDGKPTYVYRWHRTETNRHLSIFREIGFECLGVFFQLRLNADKNGMTGLDGNDLNEIMGQSPINAMSAGVDRVIGVLSRKGLITVNNKGMIGITDWEEEQHSIGLGDAEKRRKARLAHARKEKAGK